MSASRYQKLPVRQTGVYRNEPLGRLEYWFVASAEHKTMIGVCALNLPQSVRDGWEHSATESLLKELARAVTGGTARVSLDDVRRATSKPAR